MKTADQTRRDAGTTDGVFWSTVKPCRHYRRRIDGRCTDCGLPPVTVLAPEHLRIYEDFAL